MRVLKAVLSVAGVIAMAMAAVPFLSGNATELHAGSWKEVCCGSMCTGGVDYCIDTGERTCCKE